MKKKPMTTEAACEIIADAFEQLPERQHNDLLFLLLLQVPAIHRLVMGNSMPLAEEIQRRIDNRSKTHKGTKEKMQEIHRLRSTSPPTPWRKIFATVKGYRDQKYMEQKYCTQKKEHPEWFSDT